MCFEICKIFKLIETRNSFINVDFNNYVKEKIRNLMCIRSSVWTKN